MASQDDFIRTALRVPPELHRRIHESAEAANRTFNAEIVARLQSSFEGSSDAALVADQARQIWNLRGLVARMHIQLTRMRHGYTPIYPERESRTPAETDALLAGLIEESRPHLQYLLHLSDADLARLRAEHAPATPESEGGAGGA